MRISLQSFLILIFVAPTALAQPDYRVGVAVTEVVGPFQPLTTNEAFDTLMAQLREKAPNVEFVKVESEGVEFSEAAVLGKSHGFDVLMWGTIRFKDDAVEERLFPDRPTKNSVSAEADIKVYSVEREQFILRTATWVTSDEWTTQKREDLSDRQLAERCLDRAATALVGAVKRRKDTGWFQRH